MKVTVSMKATEHYFPVLLLSCCVKWFLLSSLVLTIESVNEIIKCDHFCHESY